MSKHTPGPWTIAPRSDDDPVLQIVSNYEVRPGGIESANWIAECDLQESEEENEANARLIVAAPNLLEKAKRLLLTHGCGIVDLGHCADCDDLRAAIAKAEGR